MLSHLGSNLGSPASFAFGLVLLGALEAATPAVAAEGGNMLIYLGTYTGKGSEGIYVCRLDVKSGKLSAPELAARSDNPSFLAIHPAHRYLYAANEVGNYQGTTSGAVSAFAIDRNSGKLTFLNQQSAQGGAPCHLVVDGTGRNVLVANYTGGNVASLPIGDDGRLGKASAVIQHEGSSVNPQRQKGPHAHSINLDKANRFAVAADLGLDKLLVYRFDAAKGTLVPNDPPSTSVTPGGGPRHFAFHPGGKFAYVINEILLTVTAFAYDADKGTLATLQTISTLPEGVGPIGSTAEVQVHPTGKFLYGSNRGHDSIVIYAIDPDSGKLTYVGNEPTQGKTPRNFGIDPTGTFLLAANQGTGTVVVFRIDAATGKLKATGSTIEVANPVCVKFLPLE